MAYKTLIFGVDDLFNQLQPYYLQEVQRGTLEIVAYAVIDNNGGISIVTPDGRPGGGGQNFDIAIISSSHDYYRQMKFLEAQGFPRNRIIDGRVFKVPNLNFPRLLEEGVAYGMFENKKSFSDTTDTIYPRFYVVENMIIKFGNKSYVIDSYIDGNGIIDIKNFSSISWKITFELGLNCDHNRANVGQYGLWHFDWAVPKEFFPQGQCKIEIGNDVWIGRGNILKCTNSRKAVDYRRWRDYRC